MPTAAVPYRHATAAVFLKPVFVDLAIGRLILMKNDHCFQLFFSDIVSNNILLNNLHANDKMVP
jgi:hypothetical protein